MTRRSLRTHRSAWPNSNAPNRTNDCGTFRSAIWEILEIVFDAEPRPPATHARLLGMLALLQSRPDWSGPELAERLHVTTRTIRNDVARLRELGYPVDAAPGVAGGYRLAAGSQMPPLLLDDEEVIAVAVGLRTAACTSIEGIEETALRAFAKLDQLLPTRLRKRVAALQSHVEPLHWRPPDATVDGESLAVFSVACRDHEQVRFDYADKEGAETRRLVEPFRLVPAGQRWYLVAWDVRREDWRTFRVDRASRPRLAGVRAPERELPAPDAPSFVRQAIARTETVHPTVIVFDAPVAEIMQRIPPDAGVFEVIDDHTSRFRGSSRDLVWLALQLARLGIAFTVDEPSELVDILRGIGQQATAAVERSTA
jgi:predicted DNA-binding transcriptional regulator YafY